MSKNRILLVIGVVSLLLVTMAVSRPFSSAPAATGEGANDFYQRHSDWNRNAIASDYYQRHPELSVSAGNALDLMGDFSLRHPEWAANVQSIGIPVTGLTESPDYFQRHPELSTGTGIAVDMMDYFTRHPELSAPILAESLETPGLACESPVDCR